MKYSGDLDLFKNEDVVAIIQSNIAVGNSIEEPFNIHKVISLHNGEKYFHFSVEVEDGEKEGMSQFSKIPEQVVDALKTVMPKELWNHLIHLDAPEEYYKKFHESKKNLPFNYSIEKINPN